MLNDKVYDYSKWIALILLPAIGTAYYGLAGIWNLPKPEEVVGTITIIDTFLGVILGLSTTTYNRVGNPADGDLVINTSDPEKDLYKLAISSDTTDWMDKKQIKFNVVKE